MPSHRVHHQQRLVGARRELRRLELAHQLLVDREPPGGVHDHDVDALVLGFPHTLGGDRGGVPVDAHVEHRDLDLLAELLELVDSRRAIDVRGDEQRRLVLLLQEQRQLTARGSLADALQTGHEDHRGALALALERQLVAAEPSHELAQLIRHHLGELLRRVHALRDLHAHRLCLDALDEAAHHGQTSASSSARRMSLSGALMFSALKSSSSFSAAHTPFSRSVSVPNASARTTRPELRSARRPREVVEATRSLADGCARAVPPGAGGGRGVSRRRSRRGAESRRRGGGQRARDGGHRACTRAVPASRRPRQNQDDARGVERLPRGRE